VGGVRRARLASDLDLTFAVEDGVPIDLAVKIEPRLRQFAFVCE
jgi:hypothetical protein